MGHALHFFVVEANDWSDAENLVLNSIWDWGNENNWRNVDYIVSKNGVEYVAEDRLFSPPELINELSMIDCINNIVNGMIKDENDFLIRGEQVIQNIKKFNKTIASLNYDESLTLNRGTESQIYLSNLPEENFDIFKHEFKPGCFDEDGVTHLDSEGENIYIVAVDMHY